MRSPYAEPDAKDAPSGESSSFGIDTAAGPMVLIVDDERDVRITLEVALLAEGYRVASAANGAEAIDKATGLRPAVVLTDLLMPVIDGIGLAKALRANAATAATRIVLCSGVAEGRVRLLFSGYDAFLHKPYGMEELLRTLAAVLAA
jgi:CheY-like chemotaxis protein